MKQVKITESGIAQEIFNYFESHKLLNVRGLCRQVGGESESEKKSFYGRLDAFLRGRINSLRQEDIERLLPVIREYGFKTQKEE